MTDPTEAARMELTPAGRDISQAEQDSWLKGPFKSGGFEPAAPISPLTARLLAASNAMCFSRVPFWWGGSFAAVGETRHFQRGR